MVSGLGGWSGGRRRSWRHQQLPEVVIGQFGPEETDMVTKHSCVRPHAHTHIHTHKAQ